MAKWVRQWQLLKGAGEGIEQRVAGRHKLSLRHFMQAAQLPHEG